MISMAATTPTVLLGEADDTPREMVTVHLDNFAAGRAVGDYLWNNGHRSVAFLAPSAKPRARVTRQRWQGIQSVWVDHGAAQDLCVPAPYDTFRNLSLKDQVHKMSDAILSGANQTPTAMICYNEPVAVFALQAVRDAGKSAPGDMSIATFGDTPGGAEATTPALTTVRYPYHQLATTAIAQLYSLHHQAESEKPSIPGPPS